MNNNHNNDDDDGPVQLEMDLPETDASLYNKITGKDIPEAVRDHRFDGRMGKFATDATHQKSQRDLDKLPMIHAACDSLIERVRQENRKDVEFSLNSLVVNNLGFLTPTKEGNTIYNEDSENITLLQPLPAAWNRLASEAPKDVPNGLKTNVNSWLHRKSAHRVARTFKPNGNVREMFGLVTSKYRNNDADKLAATISKLIPNEYKGMVKYTGDGGRYEISAILGRPFEVNGDAHRVMVTVRSADNGTLSQSVFFKIWRLVCTNGLYVQDNTLMAKVNHKGDEQALQEQLEHGISLASKAIESFSHHWGNAAGTPFACRRTGQALAGLEALRRIAAHKLVHVPHVRPKRLMEQLTKAFQAEPGDTVADVINAITRTAHEQADSWKSPWYEEDVEEQAGQLLYARNYTLPFLTDEQRETLGA